MKWVTRARPKTDRIACPWLIRRFIDPDAEILYVPTDQVLAVAEADGAHGFDTPGAEFDHRDGNLHLVLIDDYDLGGDPALVRLARIVHAADIETEIDTDPFAARLLALAFRARRRSRRPSAPRTGQLRLRRALRLVRSGSQHDRAPRLRRPASRHGPPGRQAHGRRRHHRSEVRGQLFLAGKHNFMETVIVEDPATARAGGVDAGPWKGTP